jgi:hypothetical protein
MVRQIVDSSVVLHLNPAIWEAIAATGDSEMLRTRSVSVDLRAAENLQRRRSCDAGASVHAEAVAAALEAVGEGAASLRGLLGWAAGAASDDCDGRRAECARS